MKKTWVIESYYSAKDAFGTAYCQKGEEGDADLHVIVEIDRESGKRRVIAETEMYPFAAHVIALHDYGWLTPAG